MKEAVSLFGVNMPTRVTFGAGCRRELPAALRQSGWKKVGVVLDQGLKDQPLVLEWLELLKGSCDRLTLALCTTPEPTYLGLEAMRVHFAGAEAPEVILGVGGGSALDMAKAMAVLVHNREPALHYRGFDRMTEPVLPVIALPTTAGTGSEVTPNASFIDSEARRKLGINGEAVRPKMAFLDPELTLSCPRGATLSAALDSLVHATEAVVAKKGNPWAEVLAVAGFSRVFRALPGVLANPGDIESRAQVMAGAFFSGVALMHSGTGPAAAMSYPLGVHHGVPHGIGGAIFLPHVMLHNAAAGFGGYEPLARGVVDPHRISGGADWGLRLGETLLECWRQWGVPGNLTELGVSGTAVERFVKDTLELGGALEQNPTPFGETEIRATLRRLRVEA
ncbi:MAG: iron-containing alcohol dehydrogenase [Magnetococcales bacterium]|nr:iron-containing alcohol dehydrogenase [Magnetococcales bacterium]MBF0156882.1 iron-containing alcohol dehydrogenase [Magnetococcales bacterium]